MPAAGGSRWAPAWLSTRPTSSWSCASWARELGATPHVAQNAYDTGKAKRRSTIDGRTTRRPGYAASQRARKRIEEVFGWIKASAGLRKTKFRGLARVRAQFTLALVAYNLIRLPKLLAVPT